MNEKEEITKIAIYSLEDGESKVSVHISDGNVWLNQSEMAQVFDTDQSGISRHIQNVFESSELSEESNMQKLHNTKGKPLTRYSLDVIISVGYRVNSQKATRFRQWATKQLNSLITKGYALEPTTLLENKENMDNLVKAIRHARTSEANLYEKVKSVFKLSSSDYDGKSDVARSFFAMAQDKFHYAVTQKTAAQIVLERADATKPKMGMQAFQGIDPTTEDIEVAKNYLNEDELHNLENISEQFLLFAESKAFRKQKMTMEELSFKLNTLLTANDYPVLYEYPQSFVRGKANEHARKELTKYRELNTLTDGKKKLK